MLPARRPHPSDLPVGMLRIDASDVSAPTEHSAAMTGPGRGPYRIRFVVHQRDRHLFVRVENVEWIEAAGNYVRLHTGKASYLVRSSLKELEKTLDPALFGRVHRGAIVNIDRVKEVLYQSFGDYEVVMMSGARVRLSRHYKRSVLG